MNLTGLGDRAQLFAGTRANADLRQRLNQRTEEMTTGVAADLVAHRKGDTAPIADLDRRIALSESYGEAAREAGNRLKLMQDALGTVEEVRLGLTRDLMAPGVAGDPSLAAASARGAFHDVVGALGVRLGDEALFAGTATSGAALAPAAEMLDSIRAAMAGATTAAQVAARLDAWFDDPAGGFATMGYRGNATDLARGIDAGATVALAARADDPALRGLLKAAALGALAADPGLPLPRAEAETLVTRARDAALDGAPLSRLRAGLGLAEERVDEATARHAARASAWGILRNEMAQVDPYGTATEVEALRTRIETQYRVTARLAALSLADYLR